MPVPLSILFYNQNSEKYSQKKYPSIHGRINFTTTQQDRKCNIAETSGVFFSAKKMSPSYKVH